MPASFDSAFALWLTQHGSETSVPVNVLAFSHPKWGTLYVCDYGEQFSGQLEAGGGAFVAEPLGFTIDVAAFDATTQQRAVIRMDNVNGLVARQLRSLTDEDLLTPVALTYRVYLNTKPQAPAIDPLNLFVVNAASTRAMVECEAAPDYLPNVGAGRRYTYDEFPSLVYL
jgi:hypothetical protein